MILLKIAFRNLREHRTKTLIIGTLIALGIAFLVVGSSVMETITKGMRDTYSESFTGDLILRNATDEDVFFISGFRGTTPPLENYAEIVAYLEQQDSVEDFTPLVTGSASINNEEESLSFAFLWGIQPTDYREMFSDTFVITAGEDLKDNKEGIVLSQQVVDDVFKETAQQLKPGDTVLLSGQNDATGTKIREVTIQGIGHFKNNAGFLGNVSFVDISTLRTLYGLTAVKEALSNETVTDISFAEDLLFGGGSLVTDVTENTANNTNSSIDFENILGDTSIRDQYLLLDNDAWHFILLKVAEGYSTADLSNQLSSNKEILGDELLVENWRWGAGFPAEIAYSIRNILYGAILVIAIVAVIIIMNTLVISVTERIPEIGTVRAIGGQRFFVRAMITLEVLMITIVFGLIGIAIGIAIIGVLNTIGLTASNVFFQILFGGATLKPILSVTSLINSLFIVVFIGILASLYPVSVALGITPVQAMQKK